MTSQEQNNTIVVSEAQYEEISVTHAEIGRKETGLRIAIIISTLIIGVLFGALLGLIAIYGLPIDPAGEAVRSYPSLSLFFFSGAVVIIISFIFNLKMKN